MKLITSNVKSFGWELRDLKGFPWPVIQPQVGVIESLSLSVSLLSVIKLSWIVYLCCMWSISHSFSCGFCNKDNTKTTWNQNGSFVAFISFKVMQFLFAFILSLFWHTFHSHCWFLESCLFQSLFNPKHMKYTGLNKYSLGQFRLVS